MNLTSFSLCPVVIAAPAQAFFHLILSPDGDVHNLCFSVKEEDNIRYYQVEGSHDLITFHKISRILARASKGLPRTYNTVIHDTSYSYYRVRQIDDMSAEIISATNKVESKDDQTSTRQKDIDQDYNTSMLSVLAYAF
jgi:hypothetical protein